MYVEACQGRRSVACAHVRSVHDDQDVQRKHARICTFASSAQNFLECFLHLNVRCEIHAGLCTWCPRRSLGPRARLMECTRSPVMERGAGWALPLQHSRIILISWILLCGVQGQVAFWPPHCQSVDLISIVICELEWFWTAWNVYRPVDESFV